MVEILLLSRSAPLLLFPPCEYPPNQIGGWHNGRPGKPGRCGDTKDQSEWQQCFCNCICCGELNNDPGPPFTPSPPPISPSLALFTQPTLPPEVVSKFLDPITNPLPFADKRGHPLCVVKCRSQSKERNNGGQLMKEQKCRYVSQGRIDQGFSVALQEFGQAGSDADDSRAGLLGGFGLDVIRFGGES